LRLIIGDGGIEDRLHRLCARRARDLAMRVGDPIDFPAGQKLVPELTVIAEGRVAFSRGQDGGTTMKRRRAVLAIGGLKPRLRPRREPQVEIS